MSDSDRIRAEVERRKQRARQLGLPEQVTQFYRNLARFYPAWKENRPELVPESLTDIRAEGKDSVEFLYNGDRYSLTWSEQSIDLPDGDVHFSGTLKLLVNGNQVFEVYLHGDFNEYTGTEWRPSDVRAFIRRAVGSAFQDSRFRGRTSACTLSQACRGRSAPPRSSRS